MIQEEARRLPQHLRDLLPPFQSCLSLVDNGSFRKGPLGGALESAMLVVLELGMFIGYVVSLLLPGNKHRFPDTPFSDIMKPQTFRTTFQEALPLWQV